MTHQNEIHGILAEYETVDGIMHAAEQVRDSGFRHWDCHTPFPVHGLDDAMDVKPTILPWIVLAGGITGLVAGMLMQWWMNAVDYPYVISGKPDWSIPANIPVAFETTVLFSAFAALFGMFILNKLPQWYNPLFRKERFSRATSDRFFVVIEAKDAQFDPKKTAEFLTSTGASAVELVDVPDEPTSPPFGFKAVAAIMTALVLLPPAMIAASRSSTTEETRFHLVPNMDFQQKFKAQTAPLGLENHPLFADGTATLKPIDGTIAQGDLGKSDPSNAAYSGLRDGKPVTEFPKGVVIDEAALENGREQYNIYCATCHGDSGKGDGMVARRAASIGQTWMVTNLLDERIVEQTPGKVFETITKGINTMPGYAAQMSAANRWDVILSLKALQKAQAAK